MFTVALIGGDGAGKTTIAKTLIHSSGLPMKYLYMGLSTESSNYALPTSRLFIFLKQKIYKNAAHNSASPIPGKIPANQPQNLPIAHGWLWNTARFLNRLAEAWYRQLISINYQLRGYIVLYDRHFFFDAAPVGFNSHARGPLLDRLFLWLMSHWYPRPTLTIYLDAPPELLYQRKSEVSVKYLTQQRYIYLQQGEKLDHFIRVDASERLDKVQREVAHHIQEFYALRNPKQVGVDE